jgi:hypothetical protein
MILGNVVFIWIIPTQDDLLPFFDQSFEFETREYKDFLIKYREEMNRPPNAHHGLFQAVTWPTISLKTLGEHLEVFSKESSFPSEKTTSSFRFLKGSLKEIEDHFQKKISSQLYPPPEYIKKLLSITLSRKKGTIYEEVTDEVLFWIIEDPKKIYEELCEVQEIVKAKNNIIDHH